jgi:hemerythrin-like domain-containing protein
MPSAIKILRDEHDTILDMLQALDTVALKLESGDPVSLQVLTDFLEFFAMLADRSHHGKEEDLLFPFLEKKGVPRAGGPIGCMLTEHDEGRAFVKAMRSNAEGCSNGVPAARHAWVQAARGYTNLLRNHIWKENEILFQIADRLLSAEEQTQMAAQFAATEAAKIDPETHTRLLHIIAQLTNEQSASAR